MELASTTIVVSLRDNTLHSRQTEEEKVDKKNHEIAEIMGTIIVSKKCDSTNGF